jgi:AcrR family transcriptional regulator
MSTATKTLTEAERPLRADARRNREAVLKAARERFAEEGIEAQIDDIARDAGVGVGTVYRHFPTKPDLVDALVAARFERFAEAAEKALARSADEPWDAFRDYMYFSVAVQAEDRALSQVMASQPGLMGVHAQSSGTAALVTKLVAAAKKAGVLRPDVVPEDVPMIICGLGRVIEAGAAGPVPAETSWKRFLAIALDGLRAPGTEKLPRVSR